MDSKSRCSNVVVEVDHNDDDDDDDDDNARTYSNNYKEINVKVKVYCLWIIASFHIICKF